LRGAVGKREERVADPGNSTRAEGNMGYPTCRRSAHLLCCVRAVQYGSRWIVQFTVMYSISVCLLDGPTCIGWDGPEFVDGMVYI
jgi:hypothetical protein